MPDAPRDPYAVLGVDRDATDAEIKAAYRKRAMRDHPDRNPGDPEAEERFKAASEAYATLRDPEKRAWVDRGGAAAGGARPDFGDVDWRTVFQEADLRVDLSEGVPRTGNAVFDALFGAMGTMMRQQGLLPGEDVHATVRIPWALARTGGTTTVRIPGVATCAVCRGSRLDEDGRPCPACGGTGKRRGNRVEVRVPRGVRPGTVLRLRGLGGVGAPPGDARVSVEVALPPDVERIGDEIHADLPVTPREARQGVRTALHGADVVVPPGTPDGATVRVPGGGLAGEDLVVRVRHAVWRGLGRWVRDKMVGEGGPS